MPRPPSARAEANLPAIRSRAERYKELLADKAVSQQDYDDAAAALKQAEADVEYWKAAVETARINLGYTQITAPISGRIGRSTVTDGALVTAYQPVALATIQQLDPIYVDVPQSTAELLRLKRRLKDGRLNQQRNEPEQGPAHPGRRHGVSAGRDAPVPRRHGGSDDRLGHPADRRSQSRRRSPAGHVRPGGGEGRRQRAGHPDPPAGRVARSEGESRRPDRGRRRQGAAAAARRSIGPSATNGSSRRALPPAIG